MAQAAPGPKLEFRVFGFTANDRAHSTVLALIRESMARMDLSPSDLRNVIVTDDDHYGPAIKQFVPNEGYTNDDIYRGIGKILPHYEKGRFVCSNLVLHFCVVGSFARPNDGLLHGELDAMRYCLYHELGHCVDYRRRTAQGHLKPSETNSVVLRCADANAEPVLAEYAACTFSAQFVTPEAFRYLVLQTADTLGKYLEALENKRQLYRVHLLDLAVLRDQVLMTFWRGLVEIAKLHAYRNGNVALQQEPFFVWPGGCEITKSVLNDFGLTLANDWKAYPDCLEVFQKILLGTFLSLTKARGYRFEMKPEGDYLWLV